MDSKNHILILSLIVILKKLRKMWINSLGNMTI